MLFIKYENFIEKPSVEKKHVKEFCLSGNRRVEGKQGRATTKKSY